MATDKTLEARVVELEIRSAYQEDLLSKLDGVVQEFADRGEQNARRIRELEDRLRAAEGGGDVGPADDKPPHY